MFFKKIKTRDLPKTIKYESSDGTDRIFISYQRDSFDFVLKLSDYLESNGIKTWYAPRNIKFSGLWPEKLHEAIQNCKALLLLYTQNADKSKHVMREVSIADEYNKPILWLKLDRTEPKSKTLKYFLELIQTVEYQEDGQVFEILRDIFSADKINTDLSANAHVRATTATSDISVEPWARGIYAFDTADEAAECAARVYFNIAERTPESTVLLPTGRSAKSIFQAMLRVVANEYDACPFKNVYLMNDTETFGVKPTHQTSRIKAINDNLLNILTLMNRGVPDEAIKFFGDTGDDCEPEDIAREQLAKYPPSVYGVSVSPYMEIMGYDVGLHGDNIVNDGPRVVDVTDETKEYIDSKQKSHSIYTVGMKSALESETLMILAFTKDKSNAIERLFKESIDPEFPITMLRKHNNAYVIITKDIAEKSGLSNFAITDLSPKEAAECISKNK